eukprot:TRINITY_DN1875_c0_g1_i2.p1 TRINITY_DN1875_c0_g1~~TRINITY_DN1875_c0_g1_i2.p1  ORF type:complete len:251 (-),score=99.23 TRINITY_DN1875_c0_g1_i2:50-802(-)
MQERVPEYPIEPEDLYKHHVDASARSKEAFHQSALGEQKQEYLSFLESKLKDAYDKIVRANDAASEALCKKIVAEMHAAIEEELKRDDFATCNDLVHRWKLLVETLYAPNSRGKFKNAVLSEALLHQMSESLVLLDQTLQAKMRAAHEIEIGKLKDEIREEKDEKKSLRNDFELQRQDMRSQIDKGNQLLLSLQVVHEKANAQITQLQSENTDLKKQIEELRRPRELTPSQMPEMTVTSKKKSKKNCSIM